VFRIEILPSPSRRCVDYNPRTDASSRTVKHVGSDHGEDLIRIVVEKALKFPAHVSPEGDRLVPHTGQRARTRDDIVDEPIARVMGTGDEVSSCVSGDLDIHQKIPAGLRY
jgi:hypothetical protein